MCPKWPNKNYIRVGSCRVTGRRRNHRLKPKTKPHTKAVKPKESKPHITSQHVITNNYQLVQTHTALVQTAYFYNYLYTTTTTNAFFSSTTTWSASCRVSTAATSSNCTGCGNTKVTAKPRGGGLLVIVSCRIRFEPHWPSPKVGCMVS